MIITITLMPFIMTQFIWITYYIFFSKWKDKIHVPNKKNNNIKSLYINIARNKIWKIYYKIIKILRKENKNKKKNILYIVINYVTKLNKIKISRARKIYHSMIYIIKKINKKDYKYRIILLIKWMPIALIKTYYIYEDPNNTVLYRQFYKKNNKIYGNEPKPISLEKICTIIEGCKHDATINKLLSTKIYSNETLSSKYINYTPILTTTTHPKLIKNMFPLSNLYYGYIGMWNNEEIKKFEKEHSTGAFSQIRKFYMKNNIISDKNIIIGNIITEQFINSIYNFETCDIHSTNIAILHKNDGSMIYTNKNIAELIICKDNDIEEYLHEKDKMKKALNTCFNKEMQEALRNRGTNNCIINGNINANELIERSNNMYEEYIYEKTISAFDET